MADITKVVNRGIPSKSRNQTWQTNLDTNDDGNPITEGDVFRINDSLGRYAAHLQISVLGSSPDSASFRVNPFVTIYPKILSNWLQGVEYYTALASGTEYHDTSMTPVILAAGETLAFDNELPIDTVEVVTLSGDFRLIAN